MSETKELIEISHEEIRQAAHDYAKYREEHKQVQHDFEEGAIFLAKHLNINIKKEDEK